MIAAAHSGSTHCPVCSGAVVLISAAGQTGDGAVRIVGADGAVREIQNRPSARAGLQSPTLREVYQTIKLPELQSLRRKPVSLEEYTRALDRWEAWQESALGEGRATLKDLRQNGDRTTYPVPVLATVADVTYAALLQWRAWLLDSYTPGVVNKNLMSLLAILEAAARAGHCAAIAKPRRLPVVKAAAKRYLTLEALGSLYAACGAATWPTRAGDRSKLWFKPAAYWRAAIVLFASYGFRTQELIAWKPGQSPLTWGQIWPHAETPDPHGQIQNPHGWLFYCPQKQEREKPTDLYLPLSPIAAAHLKSITPPLGTDSARPIFDFPRNNKSIYRAWNAIVTKAGLRPKPDPRSKVQTEYQMLHLRKTCETLFDQQFPGQGIGPLITGHAARTVSDQHYLNAEQRLLDAVLSFKTPAAWQAIYDVKSGLLF